MAARGAIKSLATDQPELADTAAPLLLVDRSVLTRERLNLALDEIVISKPTSLSDLANCEHLMNTQISDYGTQIIEVIVAVVGE